MQRILSFLPKQRTTLLFSATFSPEIKRLAGSYLQDPITIEVARPNETASTVEQRFYTAQDDDKRRVVKAVLKERGIKQAFIFVNSKLGCGRLARSLEREGLVTAALHGDKTQDERLKALEAFKKGEVDLLVCTDVAARGLDIKDVPAVFNFDVPFNAEDYVHRIGRTGRAGASGLAVTLVSPSDMRLVADIEKLIKTKLQVENYPLDEDRSRGNVSEGRREERRDDRREERRPERGFERRREEETPRDRRSSFRPAQASRDPFFEKPYEAPSLEQAAAASWEASPKTTASRTGISANIKPKRKVDPLKPNLPPLFIRTTRIPD
jgi:superfamily II DNA/RNA helicase